MGPEGWAIQLTKVLDACFGTGPDRYPIDVESLARDYSQQRFPECPITKVIADDLDGFEGALVPSGSGKRWGILYNKNQKPDRARFTVAHEFGHYLLHRKIRPNGFYCGEEDVSRRSGIGIEKEADTFAAYLLMPLHDFRDRISPDTKPTLDELGSMAARYGVSLTAAVLRWLEYTHRRAVFVVSRDGFVLWSKASDAAFRSGRFIKTHGVGPVEIPSTSRSALGPFDLEARSGIRQGPEVWFNEPVDEMTIRSEGLDLTLTLLHLRHIGLRHQQAVSEDTYEGILKLTGQ